MNFINYLKEIERETAAPTTGDVLNFEINNVKLISAPVVEHSDSSVTVDVSDDAWKIMDELHLISEGQNQKMAEFVLTFERNGEKVNKKFIHQPPMESAGITQDFVRNIAKSNKIHEMMKTEGYKLRHASAKLIETDLLPENEIGVIVRNPTNEMAKVTFECVFKKVDSNRKRMFFESIDCTKEKANRYWSLSVKSKG